MDKPFAQYKSVDLGDDFADEFEIVASTEEVDRYGDIVRQDWQLADFRKNPIILFGHDSGRPVGTAIKVGVEEKRLIAKIQLAPEGTTPDVDNLRRLIQAKIIRAASVGFYPHQIDEIHDKDGRITGFEFRKNALFEISLVSVPANPNALAISRSLELPNDFEARLFAGPDPLPALTRFYREKRAVIQSLRANVR